MHRNNNAMLVIKNVTIVDLESVDISLFIRVFFILLINGVVGGTRTPTDLSTRPSSVRVYHSATTTYVLFFIILSIFWFVFAADVLSRRTLSVNLTFSQLSLRQSATTTYVLNCNIKFFLVHHHQKFQR